MDNGSREVIDKYAAAFNRWMDDYTKNPDAFEGTQASALEFLRDKLDGREPTYGERCAAIFQEYLGQA